MRCAPRSGTPDCHVFSGDTKGFRSVFSPPCLGDCNKGSLHFLWFSLCAHNTWEQMFSTWWRNWTTDSRRGKRHFSLQKPLLGFPHGWEGESLSCNARDLGSIPGSGRSPGEGNGNPLQYSCLGNPMGRGAWRATVHGGHKRAGHNLATKQPRHIFASFWMFCTMHMGSTLKILKNLILEENNSQKKKNSNFPKLCLKGSNHSYKVTKT